MGRKYRIKQLEGQVHDKTRLHCGDIIELEEIQEEKKEYEEPCLGTINGEFRFCPNCRHTVRFDYKELGLVRIEDVLKIVDRFTLVKHSELYKAIEGMKGK